MVAMVAAVELVVVWALMCTIAPVAAGAGWRRRGGGDGGDGDSDGGDGCHRSVG